MASYDQLSIGGSPRGFAINGQRLDGLVNVGGRRCIYELDGKAQRTYVRGLLLRAPSPFDSGRHPLYVCECCADLGCGALAVRVTEVDDCFVWSDLAIDSAVFARSAYPVAAADDRELIARDTCWYDDRLERAFYFARADYFGAVY